MASAQASELSPKKGKKSPHSKLLRVCSDRNANSHFAAIEADLLRLDWIAAMDALVTDWKQQNRWDDFIELERNVRSYVDKNVIDLTHSCKGHVREWERGGAIYRQAVTLADHLRFRHFPYDRIVSAMVHNAIVGKVVLSPHTMARMDGNENKIAMAEIHERILALSKAGTLLDAMVSCHLNEQGAKVNQEGWTVHHTSCSTFHRSVLSGWFLLYRQLREANKKILADAADPGGILEATPKLETHPEHEVRVWAEKWIELCTSGGSDAEDAAHSGEGKALLGGILPTDKPLLMGVVKILSMSKDAKSQMQSVELDQQLAGIFPEE